MKTFDEILKAAYEAGYERGADDALFEERGTGPRDYNVPASFDEFRAGLSA